MKHKFSWTSQAQAWSFKSLLSLLLMLIGLNAWGDETATLTNANIVAAGAASSSYYSYAITDGSSNTWNVYAIKNYHSKVTNSNYYLQIKKYASSTAYYIRVPTLGTKIKTITLTVSSSNSAMGSGGNTATLYFSSSNSTSAAGTGVVSGTGDSSVTLDASSLNVNTGYITASGAVRIWDVTVTYETSGSETETASAPTLTTAGSFVTSKNITITNNKSGATVYYTTDGNDPTTSSDNFTGDSKTITIDATTTVKAMAVISGKDNSSIASATYTMLTTYTSFADALAAATSTATQVAFKFDGQVVTAVTTKNAYLQDASGNAAVIYDSSAHGFTQGQTLSGTVICSIQTYNGALEFTNLTSSTEGITTGTGSPTATSMELAAITASDYGKLVKIENLVYDGTNSVFKDGDNSITPYNTFMTLPTFTNGATYKITGIVRYYISSGTTIYTIAPRTTDDVVQTKAAEKQTPTLTATYETTLTAGADANVFDVTYDGDGTVAVESSTPEVATATISGKTVTVTPVKAGTTTITISAGETTNYYAPSPITYTLTVKAADEKEVTWNLSKATYTSASESEVDWVNSVCTMIAAVGSATTAPNNYLGGNNYNSTRFYKNSTLTFTPVAGITLGTITYTATTAGYATALANSTWTNATVTAQTDAAPYTVTITPTDGTKAVSATIGTTTGATSVVVTYTGTPTATFMYVSAAKYATFYDSKNAYTMPDDCEGYVFSTSTKLTKAYDSTSKTVPAGEPLVIYSETAGVKTLTYTTSSESTYKSLGDEYNALCGSDEDATTEGDGDTYYFYGLSLNAAKEANSVGFYWRKDDGAAFTNGAHKAYLKLAKSSGSVKAFVFGEEDTEDAIKDLTPALSEGEGVIYNLAGQRINKMQRGINIVNGKKYIVK